MITFYIHPDKYTHSRGEKNLNSYHSSRFPYSCEWNNKQYYSDSYRSPLMEICRQLVIDNCPDQNWETLDIKTNQRCLYGNSIYNLSKLTINEDDRGIRISTWRPNPWSNKNGTKQ